MNESKQPLWQRVLVWGASIFGVFVLLTASVGVYFYLNDSESSTQDFAYRAKQSEARIGLSSLYTAQRLFNVEYDTYTTDLVATEFQPPSSHYVFGFVRPSEDNASLGTDATRLRSADRAPDSDYSDLWSKALELCPDCTADRNGFKAIAIGVVGGKVDAWTIDHNRMLVNISE